MNKEYKNIWKFIKSEDIGISRMAISMDKGLKALDENIPDTLNPKLQLKIWFWVWISALIQGRKANAEYNLGIYNSYLKEVQ